MSRAFTKEDDVGEDLPERPVPAGPNYLTPRGLALLKQAGKELVARKKKAVEGEDLRPIDRDLRYLEARINSAIVVPPGSGNEVRFGAHVTIEDETGSQKSFQIVGEDEARSTPDTVPWSAPLAYEMFGAKSGDKISWQGPEGVVRYKIVGVSYRAPSQPPH